MNHYNISDPTITKRSQGDDHPGSHDQPGSLEIRQTTGSLPAWPKRRPSGWHRFVSSSLYVFKYHQCLVLAIQVHSTCIVRKCSNKQSKKCVITTQDPEREVRMHDAVITVCICIMENYRHYRTYQLSNVYEVCICRSSQPGKSKCSWVRTRGAGYTMILYGRRTKVKQSRWRQLHRVPGRACGWERWELHQGKVSHEPTKGSSGI